MSFNVLNKCNVDLLSYEECLEIIRKSQKSGRVVRHNLEYRTDNVMGFLGEYLHLRIITENEMGSNNEYSYFVKSLPVLAGEEKSISSMFIKEADSYGELLNKMQNYSRIKWKPECYLGRPDLIVLEDLSLSKHVHVPDMLELNVEHIKKILESLASMHASSIIYETKTGLKLGDQYSDMLFETTVERNAEWFSTGIKCLLNIAKGHPKYQSVQHQNFIATSFVSMLDPVYEMVNESMKYRNVICHRDTWRNNMLFVFDDDNFMKPLSCTLVDFQFCRYCPPAIDVLFSIYLNQRKVQRQQYELECLKWYYECLTAELANFAIDVDDHVSWETFLKSCDHIKLLPILYYGLAATVIQVPKSILLNIKSNNPDMYQKFRTVDRTEVIQEIMERDANFKCYMQDAVEELMEELLTRNALQGVCEARGNII